MNILYCGDKNIIDGLVISILSLLKRTKESLHIYVLTMKYSNEEKEFDMMPQRYIDFLDKLVKKNNKNNFVKLIDVTKQVKTCPPTANIGTRFTPYCMLRLYADLIDLPSKILYLDNDVVALKDPKEFYEIDNKDYELVGVLDYYGSHIYKNNIFKRDYINSGVLLLNLDLIKETELFRLAREKCRDEKMLLPDQHALNKLCKFKLKVNRKYNEQKKITDKTVFRHFTTTFKFFPKVRTQTIKPWNIKDLHDILKTHQIDDILEEYQDIMRRIK